MDNKKRNSNKIRILILQNELHNYRVPVFNKLSIKYDVVVIHTGNKNANKEILFREICLKSIKIFKFYHLPICPILSESIKSDVIISMFDLWWPGYLLPQILFRKKTILWGHRYGHQIISNYLRNKFLRFTKSILLYGDEDLNLLSQNKINPNKISIAWNTIHVPNHVDTSSNFKSSILFVGRLQPSKKIDIIINVFNKIIHKIKENIVLEIVGNDSHEYPGYNLYLKSIVKQLDIENRVIFHGEITHDEILKSIFSRAFVYVSPSPVGLGVLHSFSYGVPVLTIRGEYHGPEIYNIKNRENSYISDNLEDFSDILIALCNLPNTEIGRKAYSWYKTERSLEKMICGFENAIQKILIY